MHSLFGLYREDLIGGQVQIANSKNIENRLRRAVPEEGLIFELSLLGIELFTSAHGLGGEPIAAYLDEENDLAMQGAAGDPGEALRIIEMPPVDAK